MSDVVDDPEISVILSTYNRSRTEKECQSLLQRAVDSILNQTFTRFELILIDDASTDDSAEYCKKWAASDPRVRFFAFEKNSGIPAKRYNFGMEMSRGRYICFMFDDDQWELNALDDLYRAISHLPDNYGMVYGLATLYFGDDRENFQILGGKWGWNKIDSTNFIANNAVIIKRSVIDLVGGYDEDPLFLRICDWDLWWRIGRRFRVGRLKKKVAIVYSCLHDSIGTTKTLNWKACKRKQSSQRRLPLQKMQKFQIRPLLFDLYVTLCQRQRIMLLARWIARQSKKIAKKILPDPTYQWLKRTRYKLQRMRQG